MGQCQVGSCSATQHHKAQSDQDAALKGSLDKIKNKFIVMSGKGGVGKTSVSVNLAIALAKKGFKVGIMDVDIHGPDVPRMLGLEGSLGVNENHKLTPMDYSENLKAVSIESLNVGKDDAIIWRGPLKHSIIRQFIGEVAWGELDYLIIDSPPGTGDEPLSVAQVVRDAQAIIVTTPQEVALGDVRKSINFCKTVQMKMFGLIENMSGFSCPHCGKEINLFGFGGGEKTAQAMGVNFLGRIPFDPNVVSCGDSGTSFQETYADSPVTNAFAGIAEQVASCSEPKEKTEEIKTEGYAKGNNGMMKFAIPIAEGKLTVHFGHCQEFALVDVEENEIKKKEMVVPPPHEPGVLPKWLHDLGVNIIIAGGMGQRALSLFEENGIKVIIGAPSMVPEELIQHYLKNTLTTGENVCDH